MPVQSRVNARGAAVVRGGGRMSHAIRQSSSTPLPWQDPAADLIDWWDDVGGLTLASGLASNWKGMGPGYNLTAAGGLRPTFNADAFVDEHGVHRAGLIFAGAHGMQCSDPAFRTRMSGVQIFHAIVAGVSNTPAGLQTVCEYGIGWFNAAGQFGIFINDVDSFSVEAGIRGAGAGLGVWRCESGVFPWADPGVLHFKMGGSAIGSTAHQLDGVEMIENTARRSASYSAGNLSGSSTLYLGYRGDSSAFSYMTIRAFGLLGPLATPAAVLRAQIYAGAKVGQVIA